MVTAIIQARMSSSRLKGKVMFKLHDKTVLGHIFTKLGLCSSIDKIVLATSISASDDILEEEARQYNVNCFRGGLDNVLERFYMAANVDHSDIIVRICADSPLLDPKLIDDTVFYYHKTGKDIVKIENVPLGLGCEVFSFEMLSDAYHNAKEDYQKEHVTPYIYESGTVGIYKPDYKAGAYRLTLDTPEDWMLIQQIFDDLYQDKTYFGIDDILQLMKKNPQYALMNKDIQQIRVPLKLKLNEK